MTTTTAPTSTPSEAKVNRIFGILVSALMSTVFAGLFPLFALGFTTEWLQAWATGIAIGWPLGYALIGIATPPLRNLATKLATTGPQPSDLTAAARGTGPARKPRA